MYTNLRINDATDELGKEIETRLRDLVPNHLAEKFFGDKERKRRANLYSLSNQHLWSDNQNEIMELLTIISPVLPYTKVGDTWVDIDPGIFLTEYKNDDSIEILCSSELLQTLSTFDIQLSLFVYTANWKCVSLGDVFPEPTPPSPQNRYLHCRGFNTDTDFNMFIDTVNACQVNLPIVVNEPNGNYTLLLLNAPGWDNNLNEKTIEILSAISSALSYAVHLGVSFEVSVAFDMNEHRNHNVTCFLFGADFLKALAKQQMKLHINIINEH